MNDVLRLLDRMLRKQGYAIKKHSDYNLVPLKDFDGFTSQKNTYVNFNSGPKEKRDRLDRLIICLRTCINDKRRAGKRNEITGLGLEDHLLRCIHSLIISICRALDSGNKISLVIFDDRSDAVPHARLKTLCDKLNCAWEIITTQTPGPGASLHQQFNYARGEDALFYFCEDDYLHIPEAINEMIAFYKKAFNQTGSHMLIHPQEHESIYSQYNYPSYILAGENRRWRSVCHSTHTFFIHSSMVRTYWRYFENTRYVGIKEKRHLGSEKKTTDKLFRHIAGFSPIPAVAVHFQTEQSLPPFFEWETLWENNKID